MAKKILFVCTGNTCRSPMAKVMLEDMIARDPSLKQAAIEVDSAGVFAGKKPATQYTREVAGDYGLDLTTHQSKPLHIVLVDWADLVLVMEQDNMEEVQARLKALVRRSAGWANSSLAAGDLVLDTTSQQVKVRGASVELTAYEYRLLEYLMVRAGSVISKTELAEHLYDDQTDRDSNVLEVLLARLRRKLDPAKTLNPIETLRGRGYRLRLERKPS